MARIRTFAEEIYLEFIAPSMSVGSSADLALTRAVVATFDSASLRRGLLWLGAREGLAETMHNYEETNIASKVNNSIAIVTTMTAALWVGIPLAALMHRASGHKSWVGAATSFENAIRNGGGFSSEYWRRYRDWIDRYHICVVAGNVCSTPSDCPRANRASCSLVLGDSRTGGWGRFAQVNRLADRHRTRRCGMLLARSWLYDGPSYLPVWWAQAIRAWPLALALIWPAIRLLPHDFV